MPDESTTPDLVERRRQAVEAGGRRDWDGAVTFYAPVVVWDASLTGIGTFEAATAIRRFPSGSNARVQARHLQVFEWVQGEIVRITVYTEIDEARAAAERLAQERG